MRKLFTFICLITAACSATAPTSTGTLYLRSFLWINGPLELSFIYLGNDGTIVINPKLGTEPINADGEAKNGTEVGTYKISGDKADIIWRNGTKATKTIETKNGVITSWDGGIMVKCEKYAPNTKFEKSFTGGNVVSGGGSMVGSFHTYNFHNNGSFDLESQGTISTSVVGGISTGNLKGTYLLGGNTLKLTFANGKVDIFVIAPFEDYYGKEGFILNGTHFKINK